MSFAEPARDGTQSWAQDAMQLLAVQLRRFTPPLPAHYLCRRHCETLVRTLFAERTALYGGQRQIERARELVPLGSGQC